MLGHIDRVIVGEHLQQKPFLFLADTDRTLPLADVALRQPVAQPAAGAGDHFDGILRETNLFLQFTVERLFRRFTLADTPLGELPGILADPPRPQETALIIGENYPDIRAKTICVYHLVINIHITGAELDIVPHFAAAEHKAPASLVLRLSDTSYAGRPHPLEHNMALAIFDLDNTLLAGDSDHAWGEFACELGIVDAAEFGRANDAFYQDYLAGNLDIEAYLRHALAPIAGREPELIAQWHRQFMAAKIEPMLLPAAFDLVEKHRCAGDDLLIITATNRFITEPIAARFGISELLACEGEMVDGRYTGEPTGILTYAEGKVARLQQWLTESGHSMAGSCFYSDSHNDIPLLDIVDRPVAVDPDDLLRDYATDRGWPIISLRSANPR